MQKNNVGSELIAIPGVGHGFDCGFRGYKEYTPTQAKHMALARDASVKWFDKHLLRPKKENKPIELPAAKSAEKASLTHEYAVVDLSAGKAGPWPVTDLEMAPEDLLKNDAWRTSKMLLRRVPAGKFVMGSSKDDAAVEQYAREYYAPDAPHAVTLSKAFYIGVFPVTQEQWSRSDGEQSKLFFGQSQAAGRDGCMAGRARRRPTRGAGQAG